ncbi:CD109 antigen [Pholidichthys leucotaenia]
MMLGISQDKTVNVAETLKHLLTEVKNLKTTLESERDEWLQFQADLQVAVSVADRLRAEAEEELTALRKAHQDTQRELSTAQQRQKESDIQLVTLRGELKESRQRLAVLTQTQSKTKTSEPERPSGDPNNSESQEETPRGRGVHRLGWKIVESSPNEVMKVSGEELRMDCKAVTRRYLRNVISQDRSGEERQSSDSRRVVTTERSRSLSRLPDSSDSTTMQNGTTQSSSAATTVSTNKFRGQKSLDWQESRTNKDTGKQEESLNKYNSALTELPPTKSQDGFNLLLRRHGGSKRNSLLRWCQSQTQGYKNIDITNFSSSWVDGLAFCAVYHTYVPSHIPYSTLSPENKRENLSLAFKTGEAVGIAQSLTLEEMLRAGGPNWQRVLGYVESMYRHFEIFGRRRLSFVTQRSRPVKFHETVRSGPFWVEIYMENMDGKWILVVFLEVVSFAVSGSAQESSNATAFLIVAPEVIHAGTPIPLAITVFADFPSNVTAEVAHGDTKVAQTEEFQGGLTRVLTLPPVPGSKTQTSPLTLMVHGYREDSLIFANTTNLTFSLRNVSTFIQTDRSHYEPGDAVKVRIVSVQLDNHPYKGMVDISVRDPNGTIVDRWESAGNLGIVLKEFHLSQMSPLGIWVITTNVNLRISRYDGKPLSSADLMHSVVVEVTQTTDTMTVENATLTLTVPKDGTVHIKYKLLAQVAMIWMRARFQSSEKSLKLYTNYSSPSESYIQISPISRLPAQVSSKGQVVAAGTTNLSSFSLTPTLSWSPEACITVYCISSNDEITSDTAHILINQHELLKWSSEKVQPGEQVSLTVTAPESRSQVGIMVMENHNDVLQSYLDFKMEQVFLLCLISSLLLKMDDTLKDRLLTTRPVQGKRFPVINSLPHSAKYIAGSLEAVLNLGIDVGFNRYNTAQVRETVNVLQFGSADEREILLVEKYWSYWMDAGESLLWLDANVSDKTWTSEMITVPDHMTSLGAVALLMSDNLGLGFTAVPQKLIVSKYFFLSFTLPTHIIRGEEIVVEVNVFNHLDEETDVIVLIRQSEAFEFTLTSRKDVSVINGQKLCIGSLGSASALFPIRPLTLGKIEISVDGISAQASESLVRTVIVKPEGVEQHISISVFLEMEPTERNQSISISSPFPLDVVPGSQRAQVVLGGDILSLSISNLDYLVQMPVGCGEQNMIHFAPSVYILQYLERSNNDDEEIRSRALGYMREGYQKQLSYQGDDGSFSAFGTSDHSGSTWLTAFVLRYLSQAQHFIEVNKDVLTKARNWLLNNKGLQGEFIETGQLIHTQMGLEDDSLALTAYVMVAFLEDEPNKERYRRNVTLARKYLEDKVPSDGVSNYSLCMIAYALALDGSRKADEAINELKKRADIKDGVMMWTSSDGLNSHDQQPLSVQIEMVSYYMLALLHLSRFTEGIPHLKWLSTQRTHLGGFGTTQATVVALQGLAFYAAYSGGYAIDLRFNISAPTSSFVSLFRINSTNYRKTQTQEIDAEKDLPLNVYMEGRGFSILQLNIFYNLKSEAFMQNLQHTTEEEAFILDVNVTEDRVEDNLTMVSVCTKLKESQVVNRTGMAIMDVGLPSGFVLSPGDAVKAPDLLRKIEAGPERIFLYLDSNKPLA